ncbi:M23 family metallopeptidase [Aestuariivirga litoralis]|uniref:M23 family metallopeptidase n=1 Tax=Aestuariivirga litoralis TaxID=2650924 RepID=UPI0011B55046|nr:M23 family metallopeptidase [Aestuariivirga litoralis]
MNDRVDRQFRARTPVAGTTRRPPLPSKLPPRAATAPRTAPAPRALPPPAAVSEPSPDPFQVEPAHHRWLLTTCVAGIAGSLIIGSAVLGIFGENAAPRDAYASVEKASLTGMYPDSAGSGSLIGRKEFSSAYQPVVPERDLNNANLYPEITSDDLPYSEDRPVVIDAEIDGVDEEQNITTITKQVPPEPTDETFKLAKGETLIDALTDRGVSQDAAKALVASIDPIFPVGMIKPGTAFELTLDRQIDFYGREVIFPVELSFDPGPKETLTVEADEDGRFAAAIEGARAGTKSQYAQINHFRTEAKVGSSLYGTAKDNKIPDYIIAEFTRIFSYDVDFQRQVKASDTFEVFYGNPLTGSSSRRKVLHFAQLTLDGKTKTYYRYTTKDGQTDYFDEKGRSAQKSLLKTPVSGARLTSGFGMRRHPLLGYSKMHAGVDFGVPQGTPIRAAGSGVVKIAGRHGAFGIAVEIKHNDRYETLYAHMSKLAAGIRRGTKVNQGQIIGYVGSTGRSTGPHLHYEVHVDDRPVNPTRINAAGGKQLAGKELSKFNQMKQRVLAMMQQAPSPLQVAQVKQ